MANKKYILPLFAAIAVFPVFGEEKPDSLRDDVIQQSGQLVALRNGVFQNPAMQSFHYNSSLTSIAAGYKYGDATSPVKLEYGDGHSYGFGQIDAYLHKGKATVWGNATYYNGTFKNIQFCETTDFETVAPYIMADSVGGNSRREYYHFMGGFSYPVGKFNIGAEGEYTAIMEYRTRDPRPKNLTGDLKVKVGSSYQIDSNNLVGVALTARKYKQTNEVEFYNEVSVPTTYHFTGLGADYYRFRGENTSTYYKGYAIGGLIDFTNKQQKGVFASFGYDYTKIEKIISTLNQLPMSALYNYGQSALVGYSGTVGNNGYGIALVENWSKRRGKENIFGIAQDNIYPEISSATLYSLTKWDAGVQMVYNRVSGKASFDVGMDLRYADYNERYIEPERVMKSSSFEAALKLNGHLKTGRMLLSGNISGQYEWSLDNELNVSSDAQSLITFTPTAHYYSYLSQDRYNISASIEAGYCARKQFMPFMRVGWQYSHYISCEHNNCIEIAVGVKL